MKKEIVPVDYRESLELLVANNPKLTGKEILELQKYQLDCYNLWLKNAQADDLKTCDWLRINKFFKLKYEGSSNLISYLNITKVDLENGSIYFDANVTHTSNLSVVGRPNSFKIETDNGKTFQSYNNYFFGCEVIVLSEKEYNDFHKKVSKLCE